MSEEISKSKQKRLAMEAERKKIRSQKALRTFLAIIIPLAVLALVVVIVLYRRQAAIANQLDFGKYLTDQGTIANINIDEYIDFNYQDMTFSKADLLPSDETISTDIANLIDSHKYIPEDDSAISKEGDQINITYKASIDGVSYNEVTAESGGLDMTIGDAIISEEFDKAAIGHKKGDNYTTSVTYADDYSVADLAGKTVDYDITFSGIYIIPEYNDEFIAKYYSEEASSAEEYRVKIINDYYESNLSQAISESLSANYVVHKYPEEYIANDEKFLRQQSEQQYEYYQQMYAAYGLGSLGSIYDLYGLSNEEEYSNMIHQSALEETANLMAYQALFTKEGYSNTAEDVRAYFTEIGYDDEGYNNYMAEYGYKYLASVALQGRGLKYLMENVNITP